MKILNKYINVINEKGVIIGSGESERINQAGVFGSTISGLGISALAVAAMIHAEAAVLDHLPH